VLKLKNRVCVPVVLLSVVPRAFEVFV